MTVTAIKTFSFDQVMKLFKKYVSTSETRPVLKLVHFDGEYFAGTNSHVMLRIKAEYVSDIPENVITGTLFDPRSMEIVNENWNYPETRRLIPNHYEASVNLNNSGVKELHKMIKEAKKVSSKQKNKVVKFEFTHNNVTVNSYDPETENSYNSTLDLLWSNEQNFKFAASGKYMDDALMTLKKLNKLSKNDVTMGFISHMRPIHITDSEVFDIIVLPVRLY